VRWEYNDCFQFCVKTFWFMKREQFWSNGPPVALYDGLLSSGLVSNPKDLPLNHPVQQRERSFSTKIPKKGSSSSIQKVPSMGPLPKKTNSSSSIIGLVMNNNRITTTVSLQPNYKPPPIESLSMNFKKVLPNIPDFVSDSPLIGEKKSVFSRKEGSALQVTFQKLLNDAEQETSTSDSSLLQYDRITKQLSVHYLVWNELTLQIKSFNSDLASISQQIKSFIQDTLSILPQIAEKSESEISSRDNHIICLQEQIEELEKKIDDQDGSQKILIGMIEKGNSEILRVKSENERLSSEHNDQLYKIDEQRGRIDELLFRNGKLEESRASIKSQSEQYEQIIEEQKQQIQAQENQIMLFQEEGAGFKPLYNKELEKNKLLLSQIQELKNDIELLKQKKDTVDTETEPIVFSQPNSLLIDQTAKRRARRSTTIKGVPVPDVGLKVGIKNPNTNVPGSPQTSQKQLSFTDIDIKSINEISDDNPSITVQFTSTPLKSSANRLKEPEPVPTHDFRPKENSIITSSNSKEQINEKPIVKQNEEPQKLEQPKEEINLGIVPVLSSEEFEFHQHDGSLPDDYDIKNDSISIPPSMVSLVDRLFPYPNTVHQSDQTNELLSSNITKNDQDIKSFQWTLRQVFYIFRNGFEFDSLAYDGSSFMDIVMKLFTKTGKSDKILSRFISDFMRSIAFHRSMSDGIQFFLSFMNGDYSIIDFRFFNMLFNACFDYIYPSVSKLLDDPDLVAEKGILRIHYAVTKKILNNLLRIKDFPASIKEQLESSTSGSAYPSLISFWHFASSMISVFKEVHNTFHRQTRNVLLFTGWTDSDFISRTRFTEFLRIVLPKITFPEIKSMWEKMQLIQSGKPDITLIDFLKFCGDFPEIPSSIFELPYIENYASKLTSLSDPLMSIFFFMRKRYSEIIPRFLKAVNSELSVALFPYVTKIRDSFMRCDVSTCMSCYRHILQYIDFKMTEISPYQVYSNQTTLEDTGRALNHMMMRECLAALLINYQIEDINGDELVKRERKF